MILDVIAHIFKMFDIHPEALALGVMHLQQNLNFPLKIKKTQAGGSESSLKGWVSLSLSHEFVTMRMSLVILESLGLAIQELSSSAKAEYLPLMYPNWRQSLTFASWGGRITHRLSITNKS